MWEPCYVEGADYCTVELCADNDVITSCKQCTLTDGRYDCEKWCPSHYWNFYDTAENCSLATCSEGSDDYECWQETCDAGWCMTYERFGEEWVEKECSSEDDQDSSDNQDETCFQNKCEMNDASVCQINRCVNADNEMTFCELFADFGWI